MFKKHGGDKVNAAAFKDDKGRSLRICRICEQFPPMAGGLSHGMFDISMAQQKQGHSVTVIAPWHKEWFMHDPALPFRVIRIPCRRIFDFSWKACTEINRLPGPPDIVHTHGPSAFSYLARRGPEDAPLVHSLHAVRKYQFKLFKVLPEQICNFEKQYRIKVTGNPGSFSTISPGRLKPLLLERYICRHADHIAVVAEYFTEQIKSFYGVHPSRISVIYNGSITGIKGLQPVKTSVPGPCGMPAGKDIILYAGRTDWVKRVHILLGAMKEIIKKNPSAYLVVAGSGNQEHALKQIAENLNLNEHVKFTGWIPHNQILALYGRARCLCLPSFWEGTSKSILEAMGSSIPVIATDNLSCRELLCNGRAGWLVPDPSPDTWAQTIISVINSTPAAIRKKTAFAGMLLNRMYRWDHVAHRLDIVYRKVLERHHV